jgi:hypothetical protein
LVPHPDPDSFKGSESGTLVTSVAGSYSGDCNANGSGTIKANEHQTCTITNTEQYKEMKNY